MKEEENPKNGKWKPSKKAPKKAPKKKSSPKKTPVTMAQKYECAWNKFYAETPSWKREVIKIEPTGRQGREFSNEIAKQAANLAESPNFKPKLAKYLGKVEKDVKPQMLSGTYDN